jgi:hypothetical protein
MKVNIVSWNVLHIIHELNYAFDTSPVLEKYDICKTVENESNRIKDIFKAITDKLVNTGTILCLQEVPGDLLDLLLSDFGPKYHTVNSYKYSREPQIKGKMKCPYLNKSEYLVTLMHNDINAQITDCKVVNFDDPGKAAIAIHFKDLCVINTHMSFGEKIRTKALTQIYNYLVEKKCGQNYVLIGDMNMRSNELEQELHDITTKLKDISFDLSIINGDTRKFRRAHNGPILYNKIDLIATSKNIKLTNCAVTTNDDLSDHFMIETGIFEI